MMSSLILGKPLKLYVFAYDGVIKCFLAQENKKGKVRSIYYLLRVSNMIEQKYLMIEKLCLSLYFSCYKLWYYPLSTNVIVLAKTEILKYMLPKPFIYGWVGKWALSLPKFSL